MSVTPTNGNLVAAVPDPFAYKTLEHSTFAPPPEPRRCPPPRPSRTNRISNCSCEFSSSSSRNWVHAANQIYRSRSAGLCTQDIEIILHPPPGSPRLLETRYIGRCTLASPSVGALDSCPFHPLTQQGHKYILADPPSLRAGDQCKSGLAKHRYPAIKCVVFGAPLRTSEPNPSDALKNMCACRIKA